MKELEGTGATQQTVLPTPVLAATHPPTETRLIVRHAVLSVAFVLLYLLLNRPEVILFSRIGLLPGTPPSVW